MHVLQNFHTGPCREWRESVARAIWLMHVEQTYVRRFYGKANVGTLTNQFLKFPSL